MNHRKNRLESVIQDQISKIITKELEFNNALVTITEVKISQDLRFADILFSVIPSTKKKDVLKILEKSAGDIQYRLMKKIPIRKLPYIKFKYDTGPEKASNVEKIIIDNKIIEDEI